MMATMEKVMTFFLRLPNSNCMRTVFRCYENIFDCDAIVDINYAIIDSVKIIIILTVLCSSVVGGSCGGVWWG